MLEQLQCCGQVETLRIADELAKRQDELSAQIESLKQMIMQQDALGWLWQKQAKDPGRGPWQHDEDKMWAAGSNAAVHYRNNVDIVIADSMLLMERWPHVSVPCCVSLCHNALYSALLPVTLFHSGPHRIPVLVLVCFWGICRRVGWAAT